MANQETDDTASGCAGIIALLLAVTAAFFGLSYIGHLLGLTPTFEEATDRPDGWVGDHYENVAGGYVLTALVLIWLVAMLAWTVVWLQRKQGGIGVTRGWIGLVVLLVVAMLLPVGSTAQRPDQVADGRAAPKYVGMTMMEADVNAKLDKVKVAFAERPGWPWTRAT